MTCDTCGREVLEEPNGSICRGCNLFAHACKCEPLVEREGETVNLTAASTVGKLE